MCVCICLCRQSFSLYRKDIGYCEGMLAVTAMLLRYMTEEEAFWMLASLADDTKYQMDNLYMWRPNASMGDIKLRLYQLQRLVETTLPNVSSLFISYQASQWFVTIFLATDMSFETVTRIWDIYLNEWLLTVFRMGIGFLKYFEKDLLKSNYQEMQKIFRMASDRMDTEEYIKTCFMTRITQSQLIVFEKDFHTVYTKKDCKRHQLF